MNKTICLLIINFLYIVNAINVNKYQEGIMTWYSPSPDDDNNYNIACSDGKLTDESQGVALHSDIYKGLCFKCIEINCVDKGCKNKTVIAKVFDQNGKAHNKKHVDATIPLFEKVTSNMKKPKEKGEIKIKWKITNCDKAIPDKLKNN